MNDDGRTTAIPIREGEVRMIETVGLVRGRARRFDAPTWLRRANIAALVALALGAVLFAGDWWVQRRAAEIVNAYHVQVIAPLIRPSPATATSSPSVATPSTPAPREGMR